MHVENGFNKININFNQDKRYTLMLNIPYIMHMFNRDFNNNMC